MLCQMDVTSLRLWNTIENILRNVGNQTVLVTIDFHCMDKNTETCLTVSFFYVL